MGDADDALLESQVPFMLPGSSLSPVAIINDAHARSSSHEYEAAAPSPRQRFSSAAVVADNGTEVTITAMPSQPEAAAGGNAAAASSAGKSTPVYRCASVATPTGGPSPSPKAQRERASSTIVLYGAAMKVGGGRFPTVVPEQDAQELVQQTANKLFLTRTTSLARNAMRGTRQPPHQF